MHMSVLFTLLSCDEFPMPAPIDVRTDYTPDQLRAYADDLTDRAHARRVRALAAVLEGHTRSDAARIGGMERQTLRDWVHRFNAEGPAGLKSLRSPGRPPKLSLAQQEELAALVAKGPDPLAGGVRRWRLADLVRFIRDHFGVEHDEVSVGRIMKRLGYTFNGVEWRPAEISSPTGSNTQPSDEPREASSYSGNLRDVPHVLNC